MGGRKEKRKFIWKLGMVTHTCSPSTQNERPTDHCEYKANLVFIVSTRLGRVIEGELISLKSRNNGPEKSWKRWQRV